MRIYLILPTLLIFVGTYFINTQEGFAAKKQLKNPSRKQASIPTVRCTGKSWKNSRNLSPAQLHKIFNKTSRQDLTQNLWFELTMRPKNNLTLHLLQYLIETEKQKDLKSYYQVLGAAAYNSNTPIYQLYYKNKLKRPLVTNNKIKTKEICDLYQKALRGPK